MNDMKSWGQGKYWIRPQTQGISEITPGLFVFLTALFVSLPRFP